MRGNRFLTWFNEGLDRSLRLNLVHYALRNTVHFALRYAPHRVLHYALLQLWRVLQLFDTFSLALSNCFNGVYLGHLTDVYAFM